MTESSKTDSEEWKQQLTVDINRDEFKGIDKELKPEEQEWLVFMEQAAQEKALLKMLNDVKIIRKQLRFYLRQGKKPNPKNVQEFYAMVKECAEIFDYKFRDDSDSGTESESLSSNEETNKYKYIKF